MRYHVIALAIMLAAPLSAQDNRVISLNDTTVVNIFDNDSTFIFIEMAPPDSAEMERREREVRANEQLAEYFATCGCVGQGPSTRIQVATAGIALALGLIWWELRKGNKNGVDGKDGAPGRDGVDGVDGKDGVDGRDATHDDDSESEH